MKTDDRDERGLTPRQIEVLRLVADGFSSKEIAQRLSLSSLTVDAHINAAMKRLGVEGRREAARRIAGVHAAKDAPNDYASQSPRMAESTPSPDIAEGRGQISTFWFDLAAPTKSSPGGMLGVVARYITDALYVAVFFVVMSLFAYGSHRLVALAEETRLGDPEIFILQSVAVLLAPIDGFGVVVASSLLTIRFIRALLHETD